MAPGAFEVICEVEPATRPDLMQVRHQIGVMSRIASGFLIPDNHIGRACLNALGPPEPQPQPRGSTRRTRAEASRYLTIAIGREASPCV